MSKSPDAFRTISEVAETLDIPQHVLRFWEGKFPQIKPLKRAGGRRYYRPEDVDLLRGIRALLYAEGYTIKGVQKVLRETGPRHVSDLGRVGLRKGILAAAVSHPAEPAHLATVRQLVAPDDDVNLDKIDDVHSNVGETPTLRDKLEAALAELLALRDLLRRVRVKVDAA